MKVIGIVVVGFVLLLLLMMDKKQIQKVMERLSVLLVSFSICVSSSFHMNVAGGFIGIYVPVILRQGWLLAVLGIPGFATYALLHCFCKKLYKVLTLFRGCCNLI